MLARMRRVIAAVFVLALGACDDNPNIDGSKVAATGATCTEICGGGDAGRIQRLCGYAPPNCDNDDGGYCQTNFDDTILACMSTAASCQAAWDCTATVTTPTDDASTDAGDETSDDASSPD